MSLLDDEVARSPRSGGGPAEHQVSAFIGTNTRLLTVQEKRFFKVEQTDVFDIDRQFTL